MEKIFNRRKILLNLHATNILQVIYANKANQHGSLKALRQKHATLLTPSYLQRYVLYPMPRRSMLEYGTEIRLCLAY